MESLTITHISVFEFARKQKQKQEVAKHELDLEKWNKNWIHKNIIVCRVFLNFHLWEHMLKISLSLNYNFMLVKLCYL